MVYVVLTKPYSYNRGIWIEPHSQTLSLCAQFLPVKGHTQKLCAERGPGNEASVWTSKTIACILISCLHAHTTHTEALIFVTAVVQLFLLLLHLYREAVTNHCVYCLRDRQWSYWRPHRQGPGSQIVWSQPYHSVMMLLFAVLCTTFGSLMPVASEPSHHALSTGRKSHRGKRNGERYSVTSPAKLW